MDAILGLGLALPIVASTGIATTTATRMLKFHLDVLCSQPSRRARELHGGIVVLRNDKLYIEEQTASRMPKTRDGNEQHPFTGFYLSYPDEDRPMTRGLVSTVSRDPPMLNWIYVDKDTMELKYSNRSGSIAHHVGDFDWTTEHPTDSNPSCVTFDGWEGFVAVEETSNPPVSRDSSLASSTSRDRDGQRGEWALYFDMQDDGLKGYKMGRRTLEVSLQRRVISDQEVNKWGIGQQGNMGVKATREV
ncbi:hypothetical protein H2203_002577 [Taxawa tesnikishii (nom. ined.)]|nr:hypothetical protein H2203_002577 [Dothideales sp. JES 119]